ncbi:Hypp7841 [Branchiostoma lanceolatum]|uniref:Hypp7841 protein n=1 Tax=Branchiostoma lanceolatum TaxID=7740 RepID=A0A8J9Z4W1_BRALA|nr:Hypp7841 [Branchiostoma lanceolatum]
MELAELQKWLVQFQKFPGCAEALAPQTELSLRSLRNRDTPSRRTKRSAEIKELGGGTRRKEPWIRRRDLIRAEAARGILTRLPAALGGNLAFRAHVSSWGICLPGTSVRLIHSELIKSRLLPRPGFPHVPPRRGRLPYPHRRAAAPGSAAQTTSGPAI